MSRLFAVVVGVLAVIATTLTPANADTPATLSAGSQYWPSADGRTQNGMCTIAAVGYDRHGDKVALTAGHCAAGNSVAITPAGKLLGSFGPATAIQGMAATGTDMDYVFIRLHPSVVLVDDPRTPVNITAIGTPQPWTVACKYGHGMLNVGERCGLITGTTGNVGCSTIAMFFGDSGGPVYVGNRLIGVVSGLFGSCGVMTFFRADHIIRHATQTGGVGAGFTPTA